MPKENGRLRATPVARAHDGGLPPRLEEDGRLGGTPVTASVTQLKGMAPKPELPASLEAMDKAIARAVAGRPE